MNGYVYDYSILSYFLVSIHIDLICLYVIIVSINITYHFQLHIKLVFQLYLLANITEIIKNIENAISIYSVSYLKRKQLLFAYHI